MSMGRREAAHETGLEPKQERFQGGPRVRVSVRSGLERRPAKAGRPIDVRPRSGFGVQHGLIEREIFSVTP